MKTKRYVSLGILCTLALGGMSVYASSTPAASATLPEYVVTATRSMKTQLNSPANTVVLTQKQMKQAGYNNVYEAIHELAQVPAEGYSDDSYDYGAMVSRLNVRGLQQGTLLLLNGNPIDYTNYAILGGIPLDQVKKIEVVKGSGSALYGSAAIAGTINIITEKPQKSDKVTGDVSVGVGTQRKSANLSLNADRIIVGYSTDRYKDREGVSKLGSTGNGKALAIQNKHGNAAYAMIKLSPITTLSYSHTEKRANLMTGTYTKYVPKYDQYGRFLTTTNYWNLAMNNHKTGWKASAGWNEVRSLSQYDEAFALAAKPKNSPYGFNDSKAHTLNLDVQKKLLLRDNKDSLILGATFTQNEMDLIKTKYKKKPVYSSDKTTSYALYQSYEYNPTNKFTAILGLREYLMTPSTYQQKTFRLLPQLQLLYRDTDHSSYFASVGRSFIMPRINYGFSYGEGIASVDLKPQEAWNYELGYKYDNGTTSLTADMFYLNVTNKFSWTKVNNVNIMQNLDKWHNTGLEVNINHKFSPMWSARSGLTWQSPVAISKGTSEQDASKILWNTGATYTNGKLIANADLFLNLNRPLSAYDSVRSKNGPQDHRLANRVDLRLALHYMPNAEDTISVIGTNLLNRKDVINIYEYEVAPRAVFVSYGHKF